MSSKDEGYRQRVETAAAWLRERLSGTPDVVLVLGTGIGTPAGFEVAGSWEFEAIPGVTPPSTKAHDGVFHHGRLAGRQVGILAGRLHYYEGLSLAEITLPLRVMARLGTTTLIITNAAGGLNPDFGPGDLMVISDHINLMGASPLRGENIAAWGPRYPDMSAPYPVHLRQAAREAAADSGLPSLAEGVYAAVAGPQLETPAETRMLIRIGADAVGMSTVPEVIVAVHEGIEVLGLSVITNCNDPDAMAPISEDEVIATAGRAEKRLHRLLTALLPRLPR